jgi:hypothetical protein
MNAALDLRHRAVAALSRARGGAYLPEAYVGQESFVSAPEILALAAAARIGAAASVRGRACSTSAAGWAAPAT